MHQDVTLIATIAVCFVLAFVFGFSPTGCACRRWSAISSPASSIGPFTPGFVADGALAGQLAEMGVILLMFGVGLHFSASDLLAVRGIAIPGRIGQIVLATLLGVGLALALGLELRAPAWCSASACRSPARWCC